MVMTLYKLDASAPVRAVFMTIQALKITDIEYVDINVVEGDQFKDEYLKMNPHHTIPLLNDDGFLIWDSHAISTYLVTKYSHDSSLYPMDPKKRATIDQRLHFDSGVLFPSIKAAVIPVVYKGEKAFRPEHLENIKAAYDLTEKITISTWMAGEDVTLADICCVATISSLNEILPIDPATYPNLAAWMKRCSEEDFYKKGNVPGLDQLRMRLQSRLA